jgi:flagellar motor component MotA
MYKGIIYFLFAFIIVFLPYLVSHLLLSIPSFLFVIGTVVTLLFIAFSFSDMGEAAGFVFGRDREISRGKYLKLSHLYSAVGDYALYCGLLGTIIGFERMWHTFQYPTTIPPEIAASFVTLLYGITVKLLAILAQRKLELCRVTDESYEMKPRKQLRSLIIGGILFILIVVPAIIQYGSMHSFINFYAVLFILGGSLFVALLFVPGAEITDSFKATFSSCEVTGGRAKKAIGVFTRFNDVVVSLAIIAAVGETIVRIRTVSDLSALGPGLAELQLVIYYGIIFICFIRGLFCIAQRRLAGMGEQSDERPVFNANAVILLGLAGFIIFVIVLVFSV